MRSDYSRAPMQQRINKGGHIRTHDIRDNVFPPHEPRSDSGTRIASETLTDIEINVTNDPRMNHHPWDGKQTAQMPDLAGAQKKPAG